MIDEYAQPKKREKSKAPENYVVELKYDGSRQFLFNRGNGTELYNKRGKNKTRHFPDITRHIALPEGVILDGEVIVTDDLHPHGNKDVLHKRDGGKPVLRRDGQSNFKQKLKMEQYEATFVAFDIVEYKNDSVRDMSLQERRELLEEVVGGLSEEVVVSRRYDALDKGWEEVLDKKMEGLVLKDPESSYPNGRTSNWIKVKNTQETILTAHDFEEHSRGITVIGEDECADDHRLTVNGGVSDKVKGKIEEKGSAEVEVSFLERSDNDKLREPTFKRLCE